MGRNVLSWLSTIALIAGGVIAAYVFMDIYLLKRALPPGSCPVLSNRPLMYVALALCILSLVLSFFVRKQK